MVVEFEPPQTSSAVSPMSMIETYQGSVNKWECDGNDHQNVRFYIYKANQSLVIALEKLRITDHAGAVKALHHIRSHHIRFLREARATVPLVIENGVLEFRHGESIDVLSLMRNTFNRDILATFVTRIDLRSLQTSSYTGPTVALPDEASPRGIPARSSEYSTLDIAAAKEAGFHKIGAGVIEASECDSDGNLEPYRYISRVSDGMANLRALTYSVEEMQARDDGTGGGAMLEYRAEFHHRLTCDATFLHLAGFKDVGNKTQTMVHLMFDETSGSLAVSAETLNVTLDLVTRRSTPIPGARRERIQAIMLKPVPGDNEFRARRVGRR